MANTTISFLLYTKFPIPVTNYQTEPNRCSIMFTLGKVSNRKAITYRPGLTTMQTRRLFPDVRDAYSRANLPSCRCNIPCLTNVRRPNP